MSSPDRRCFHWKHHNTAQTLREPLQSHTLYPYSLRQPHDENTRVPHATDLNTTERVCQIIPSLLAELRLVRYPAKQVDGFRESFVGQYAVRTTGLVFGTEDRPLFSEGAPDLWGHVGILLA
jgi:hypothetical protein